MSINKNVTAGEKETTESRIYLEGCACRETVYRTKSVGMRITDIMMSAKHPNKRTDYLPCIS